MNWEAIGAVGEILGAAAVVATLFYLATQTRRATEVNRSQTFQAIFDGITQHNNEMWSAANAELMIKGFGSFDDLSAIEKGRFDNLVTNLFNQLEMSMVAHAEGLLDQATMDNWSWYMQNQCLVYPGIREWWPLKRLLYPRVFREWIDREMEAAQTVGDFYGILG